jgi:hypothetical protein
MVPVLMLKLFVNHQKYVHLVKLYVLVNNVSLLMLMIVMMMKLLLNVKQDNYKKLKNKKQQTVLLKLLVNLVKLYVKMVSVDKIVNKFMLCPLEES